MRPVRLQFAGLRSYRGETTIDFSELNLFAVIGDTGAGKSTIIEALCLALYGKRSWSGGGVMTDMICDGVNTMRIEFTFGVGDRTWTVTRARHRNSSGPIDKLVDAEGAPLADGARSVNEAIEEIVGLNFGQFTQAVVLPQGRFDTLLRATESDRNKILTSILDLGDVVAARDRADALLREWKPKTEQLKGRREGYPADPAAVTAEARQRLDHATAALASLDAARKVVDEHLKEQATIAGHRDGLRSAVQQVRPAPADLSRRLDDTASTWQVLHAERAAADESAVAAATEISALEQRVEGALDGFVTRDDLVAARTRLDSTRSAMPTAVARLSQLRDRRRAADAERPTGEIDTEFEAAVTAASDRHSDAAAAADAAEAALNAGRTAWEAWSGATARAAASMTKVEPLQDLAIEAENAAERAETEHQAAKQRLEDARNAERSAVLTNAAREAAATCAPGDPCPICERDLPDEFQVPASEELLTEVRAELTDASEAEASAAATSLKLAKAATKARSQADAAGAAAVESAADQERHTASAAEAGVDVAATDAEMALAELAAADRSARKELSASQVALEGARTDRAKAAALAAEVLKAFDAELAQIETSLAEAEGEVERCRKTIEELPATWRERLAGAEDADALSSLIDALEVATNDLRRIEEEREKLVATRETSASEERRLADEIANSVLMPIRDDLRLFNEHTTSTLALLDSLRSVESSPEVSSDLLVAIETPDAPAVLKGAIAVVDAALTAAEEVQRATTGVLERLEAQWNLSTSAIERALSSVGCDTADSLSTAVGAAGSELGHAESAVVIAAAQQVEAEHLDSVLEVAAPFTANLSLLNDSLRDSNFIAHLVDARERELLAEAARRLNDITKGRFTFAKDFGVVSISSGEKRPPDALSGGERFQAALALALALVEIASRGGGQLDAVFVDEGFGSLDSNALDVALETLGTVAGAGKSVALISHLRPVAEYVDTVLHVTKDDMFGSRIEVLDSDAKDRMLDDDIRSGLTA